MALHTALFAPLPALLDAHAHAHEEHDRDLYAFSTAPYDTLGYWPHDLTSPSPPPSAYASSSSSSAGHSPTLHAALPVPTPYDGYAVPAPTIDLSSLIPLDAFADGLAGPGPDWSFAVDALAPINWADFPAYPPAAAPTYAFSASPSPAPGLSPAPDLAPAPSRRAARPAGSPPAQKCCAHCAATTTPLWRREPGTQRPLCNACGLYLQQRGARRPQALIDADRDEPEPDAVPDAEYTGPRCAHCATRATSVWRRGADGRQVCNACGVYQRLRGKARPLSLRRNKIKPRTKHTPRAAPA